MRTYKLKFDNEAQAQAAVEVATNGMKSWDYDVKVIGIHTKYEYDEDEPIATVMDGWHVDVVSMYELEFDAIVMMNPKNPIHEFAGV